MCLPECGGVPVHVPAQETFPYDGSASYDQVEVLAAAGMHVELVLVRFPSVDGARDIPCQLDKPGRSYCSSAEVNPHQGLILWYWLYGDPKSIDRV